MQKDIPYYLDLQHCKNNSTVNTMSYLLGTMIHQNRMGFSCPYKTNYSMIL